MSAAWGYHELSNGGFTLVDDVDLELIASLRWRWKREGQRAIYAVAHTPDGGQARMHRLLLGAPDGSLVDHVNGNGLDNRRSNLRLATASQNQHNQHLTSRGSSRFKGVTWHRQLGKWQAQIRIAGVDRYLGVHASEEEAARSYDAAARRLFGEFAHTNFQDAKAIKA